MIQVVQMMEILQFPDIFYLVFRHPADHLSPGHFCKSTFYFHVPVSHFSENAGDPG